MLQAGMRLLWVVGALWLLTPGVSSCQPTDLGETIKVQSEILDQMRTVYVNLPASYHQSRRSYPVLYLLDANWHFPVVASQVRYLSECRASDIIAPELIVVGIENVDRDHDFTPTNVPEYKGMEFPTSGGASAFLRFLEGELIPLIDRTYRTVDHRVLGGWSFGGLFTAYSLFEKPALFNAYVGISPSLWWEGERLLEQSLSLPPERPTRLVMTIGADEEGGMNYAAVTRFSEILRRSPVEGLEVTFLEIEGAGHNQSLPLAYYRSIRALYEDWLAPDEVVEAGRKAVGDYYRRLSQEYGYAVPVPEQVLIRLGLEAYRADDYKRAEVAFAETAELYPESSMARYLVGRAQHKNGLLEAGRREYLAAIELELRQQPPDGLNLRHYRSRLAEVDSELAGRDRAGLSR